MPAIGTAGVAGLTTITGGIATGGTVTTAMIGTIAID